MLQLVLVVAIPLLPLAVALYSQVRPVRARSHFARRPQAFLSRCLICDRFVASPQRFRTRTPSSQRWVPAECLLQCELCCCLCCLLRRAGSSHPCRNTLLFVQGDVLTFDDHRFAAKVSAVLSCFLVFCTTMPAQVMLFAFLDVLHHRARRFSWKTSSPSSWRLLSS